MNNQEALEVIQDARNIANDDEDYFGGAGGGPSIVRHAVNRLDAKPGTPDAQARFARDILHTHFDTGLDMTMFVNGKAFLDTIFVDFDTIDLPGGW